MNLNLIELYYKTIHNHSYKHKTIKKINSKCPNQFNQKKKINCLRQNNTQTKI